MLHAIEIGGFAEAGYRQQIPQLGFREFLAGLPDRLGFLAPPWLASRDSTKVNIRF
jgi:hypothetical protein